MGDASVKGKRKKRLIWTGAIGLAVVVLVILPGYVGSRPSFFGRYPSLTDKHDPWSKSTHAKATCQDCHVRPGVVARTGFYARMAGEFYASLALRSRTPQVFPKPTSEACLSCHEDLRSVSPEGDLKIPHKAHVNILKMDCVQCHNYLVHEKSPEGGHRPTMAGCLKCHDGDTAKNSCDACHTKKATPKSHEAADWLVIHPEQPTKECEQCHKWTEKWCEDCHSRRPRSHTAAWRSEHGARVAERRNCETCHTAQFCTRCHGAVPQLNYDPDMKLVR